MSASGCPTERLLHLIKAIGCYGRVGDNKNWCSAGDDFLTCGDGSDQFRFIRGFGSDTISDFSDADENTDVLDLTFIEGLALAEIQSGAEFDGGNTVLTVGNEGSITLIEIDKDQFQQIIDAGQTLVG